MERKDREVSLSLEQLLSVLEQVSEKQINSGEDAKLGEFLQLDSLEKVKLASQLESVFGIDICESRIMASMTIGDLLHELNKGELTQNNLKVNEANFGTFISSFRFLLQTILLPLLRIFYSIKVEGIENVGNITSPHIFAINHTSHLDTPTFIKAMPHRIRKRLAFAAAADVFYSENRRDSLFFKLKRLFFEVSLNIFPFSRKVSLRKSVDNCIQVIDMGYHVCIYPEGKRTLDGDLMDFKSGVGILAHKTKVPIVPVKIEGLFSILKKGQKIPTFGKVVVKIGEPYKVANQSYTEIVKDIKERVKNL